MLSYEDGNTVEGRATSVHGKQTDVTITRGSITRGQVTRIRVVGREDATPADNARNQFILNILQGTISIDGNDFIRRIYFPTNEDKAIFQYYRQPPQHAYSSLVDATLNSAQSCVAQALLSPDSHEIMLVQGPPGTGKTRTIAAVARVWAARSMPAWIVAQSNVGVKRIAETLIKRDCKDFLLLVSKEFYVEW